MLIIDKILTLIFGVKTVGLKVISNLNIIIISSFWGVLLTGLAI